MTVHVGVIGCGAMGGDHVRTLTTAVGGAAVTAVCDADPGRAAEAARTAAGARVHADPLDLIGDPDVHAVLIASGDDSHEELVLACLAAGKPVLCKKPLATTPEAGLRVVEAEAAGRIGAALMPHSVHRDAGYPPTYPTASWSPWRSSSTPGTATTCAASWSASPARSRCGHRRAC